MVSSRHASSEIDQVYSRVFVGLRKRAAATRTLLGEGIVSSHKANAPNFRVDLEHLYNCATIRDLVHECMFSISHVTKPQAFKVSKDPSDGVARMQVQQRSYEDAWGVINRQGGYGPGYITVMKSCRPDVRDSTPHPRKSLPEATLNQHRHCIESCDARIKNEYMHANSLPDGVTADGLYNSMEELAESVVELSRSTPVLFGWGCECNMYNLDNQEPASDSNGSQETATGAAGGTGAAGAGSVSGRGTGSRARKRVDAPVFHVEVGEFVALPTSPGMASILVGKVESVEKCDWGDELELRWYMPVQVRSDLRSGYGKGAWTPEFILESGKRVPSMGGKNVRSVCAKFASLTAQGKLPSHVWKSVLESTLPMEEAREGAEGEGGSTEGDGGSTEGDGGSTEGVVGSTEDEGGSASSSATPSAAQQPQSPQRPQPLVNDSGGGMSSSSLQDSVAPSSVNDAARESRVRLTAAAFRPRRGVRPTNKDDRRIFVFRLGFPA
ncbi:unnamed protein product [Ectocarpus sp. 4 AP-2014]